MGKTPPSRPGVFAGSRARMLEVNLVGKSPIQPDKQQAHDKNR
jgi:hypothetical protein